MLACLLSCQNNKGNETDNNNSYYDTSYGEVKTENADCDSLISYISKLGNPIFDTVYIRGIKAIPCLIDHLDDSKNSPFGFKNPKSSYIPSFFLKGNQIGIKYAYLIELILAKDTLESSPDFDWNKNNWEEATKPYRIYDYCVIVRKDENQKPIEDILTNDDMKKIKLIYLAWWKKNQNKSIEQLRNDYKQNGSILKDSDYMWV